MRTSSVGRPADILLASIRILCHGIAFVSVAKSEPSIGAKVRADRDADRPGRYIFCMSTLYPLKFEPIFKENIWGGDRLRPFLRQESVAAPTGEAWVVSDVDGSLSKVANGPLAGTTLRALLATDAGAILGTAKPVNGRFPLLLKFLDARQELSVQVHPTDEQARAKTPGQNGKTEAWVVLDADPASKLYAGFRPGTTDATFREAMAAKTTPQTLHQFVPTPGDCVFLRAGTVHAIGANLMLFEVQQTSDITYRLYDWDRIDIKTGQPRDMHLDDGLACSNFAMGPCDPVTPVRESEVRERLVACEYFTLHRIISATPMRVGERGTCKVLVCTNGSGTLGTEPIHEGDAVLLPATLGEQLWTPHGNATLLECGIH